MSVKVTLSPRHARVLSKLAHAGARLAANEEVRLLLTPDEADAAPHALARLQHAMAKHRVPA